LANGITDWVYEEEFAFVESWTGVQLIVKVAYIRFDESKVPEFDVHSL
jgi:dipeptidyl-peptidase-4